MHAKIDTTSAFSNRPVARSPIHAALDWLRLRHHHAMTHDDLGRWHTPQEIPLVIRIDEQQRRRLPDLNAISVLNLQRLRGSIRHHIDAGHSLLTPSHLPDMHSHVCYLKHASSTKRVPWIHDIVVAKAHIDARLP